MANPLMPEVAILMFACLTSRAELPSFGANLMIWGDLKRFGLAASFASHFRFACFFFADHKSSIFIMTKRYDQYTINSMFFSAGLVQMLLRNPKK